MSETTTADLAAEHEAMDRLTTEPFRSLYLYRGDGGWSGTAIVNDGRPSTEIAYTDDRRGYVVLDGSSLHVLAYGASRGEVLRRLLDTYAEAEVLLARVAS